MPATLSRQARDSVDSSTQLVLREAKRLHRAATSDSPSTALPVLRRLLAAAAVPTRTLPRQFVARHTVQRKHLLCTLAREAGYPSWEEYRGALPLLGKEQILRADLLARGASTLKLWFSNEAEATAYAAEHGGHVVRVGQQAVVLPVAEFESDAAGS